MTSAHEVQTQAQRVIEATRHLLISGVLSHSGLANLSARLDADRFLLTTTGYVRKLRPDQLATVGLDGKVLDGELAPENAEIVAMHSVVYNARSDVGAVIHTHSPAATAFALAHRPLPCRFEPRCASGRPKTCRWRHGDLAGRVCRPGTSPRFWDNTRRRPRFCWPTTVSWRSALTLWLLPGWWWRSRKAPRQSSPRPRSGGRSTSPTGPSPPS